MYFPLVCMYVLHVVVRLCQRASSPHSPSSSGGILPMCMVGAPTILDELTFDTTPARYAMQAMIQEVLPHPVTIPGTHDAAVPYSWLHDHLY